MSEDLSMMLSPNRWPLWPHLPMKKSSPEGGFPLTAVLIQLGDGIFLFYPDNVWKTKLGRKELQGNPERGGRDMLERLVNDGWVVD